jgi:hypothetical protein
MRWQNWRKPMLQTKRLSRASKLGLLLLLVLLGACATPTARPIDVGQVVVTPKVQLPPMPEIVQQTKPKPVGYFQSSLLGYFNGSPAKPTP